MEFLAPLLAALRPVVTAEAIKILDQVAAKAASGAEEDVRQAERDLLAWMTRHRDCGHDGDLADLREQLNRIETKVGKVMTDQDTTNQLAAQIEADVQAQSVATQNILTEISQLETANPGIDFTSLKQAVADLDTQTAAEQAVVPQPAPPADGSGTTDGSGDGSAPAGQ